MAQKALPYEYEIDEGKAGLTALGGLPAYLDLAWKSGLIDAIDRNLKICVGDQGWTDRQMIASLILLNLAGGDCVEDIDKLEGDEGFCRVLRRVEAHGLTRKQKLAFKRRWRRKGRTRTMPSASALFRYLAKFHDAEQEKLRVSGKSFIPASNKHLKALCAINKDLIGFDKTTEETATMDMDATLSATFKKNALYSYKGEKAYQPVNTYWHERGLIVHTEFRDGNVNAGVELLRVFTEALECLPVGVKKVRLRSDTAGYKLDLLRYCEEGGNKRFGRIEFAVSCTVTSEFRKAVAEVAEDQWRPLKQDERQWAEICFVPGSIGYSKKGPAYRYLAIREEIKQADLPGLEKRDYPCPVAQIKDKRYKVFGVVTNMDWNGQELIQWLYQRCGKSEEAHAAIKNDFAGGRFPSGDFGENAAWWWIAVIAHNLNALMKRLALGESWMDKRMKAVRFGIINIAARVIEHSRGLFVKLAGDHLSSRLLLDVRSRIAELAASG
ncbi:MAG: IS1380 family transposase [Nitrospiraceae bacterium]|nr:IS1380 family transposase [Nitrospiraceae bacterium]